jgi:hypothetical protein
LLAGSLLGVQRRSMDAMEICPEIFPHLDAGPTAKGMTASSAGHRAAQCYHAVMMLIAAFAAIPMLGLVSLALTFSPDFWRSTDRDDRSFASETTDT